MERITALVHPEVLAKLRRYRKRVLRHRRRDPRYLDPSYTQEEAAGTVIGYGLDFVENISPEREELIGLPKGTVPVLFGPRVQDKGE